MAERILVNLLSRQTMPNYIAVKQLRPDRVIAMVTDDFKLQSDRMQHITGVPHQVEPISPYGLKANSERIKKLLHELPDDSDITVNFTGGTKLMSLAAALPVLEGGREKIKLAYVDTEHNEIIFAEPQEGRSYKLSKASIRVVANFKDFVGLAGEILFDSTTTILQAAEERYSLSEALLDKRFNPVFSQQHAMFDRNKGRMQAKQEHSLKFNYRSRPGNISWSPTDGIRVSAPGGRLWHLPDHHDGGGYFTGGWLEEFVFTSLKNHKDIHSAEMNVVLTLSDRIMRRFHIRSRRSPRTDKNELDVVAIRGVKGAIIECKAGKVTQDHIYKLATLRDHLFGLFGIAVLACRFPISNPSVVEKARDSRITVVYGERIRNIGDIVSTLL